MKSEMYQIRDFVLSTAGECAKFGLEAHENHEGIEQEQYNITFLSNQNVLELCW